MSYKFRTFNMNGYLAYVLTDDDGNEITPERLVTEMDALRTIDACQSIALERIAESKDWEQHHVITKAAREEAKNIRLAAIV